MTDGEAAKPKPKPITKQGAATARREESASMGAAVRSRQRDHRADQDRRAEADRQVEPPGVGRRQRPPQGQRGQREAGAHRAVAEHPLRVERDVRRDAHQQEADDQRDRIAAGSRGGGRPTGGAPAPPPGARQHEARPAARREAANSDDARRGRPGPRHAALQQGQQQEHAPGGQQHGAEHVEPVPRPVDLLVEPRDSITAPRPPIGRLTKKIQRHDR